MFFKNVFLIPRFSDFGGFDVFRFPECSATLALPSRPQCRPYATSPLNLFRKESFGGPENCCSLGSQGVLAPTASQGSGSCHNSKNTGVVKKRRLLDIHPEKEREGCPGGPRDLQGLWE